MQNNTIVNVAIGASCLKIIHCEKKDTDIVIKNSVILETGSNLYLNKEALNIGFIEDKLRMFMFENKINSAKICFTLPEYIATTKFVTKQQVVTNDYITGLIKTKQLHELLDENIPNEEDLTFDCQILNTLTFNSKDENDGSTELIVSYMHKSVVKSLTSMCKRLKMTPSILETESISLTRLIDMFNIKDNYLFIDIGEVYTKLSLLCGTSTLETQVVPAGVYTIDGLLSKLFNCPPIIASQRRFAHGLKSENETFNLILEDVVKDIFAVPIIEQLNDIQSTYGGLHYIKKIIILGGAWNIPHLKELLYSQTLELYGSNMFFEDISSLLPSLIYDNKEVEEDILSNLNSYASCIGLSLRGGL